MVGTAHNDDLWLEKSLQVILEAVFTTLFHLRFSLTVIEPNHIVIEKARTLLITAL